MGPAQADDRGHERPEPGDRHQQRSHGVGKDMNIGRAEIEVPVVVMIVMIVVVAMIVAQ
jgi:hypothetical protein